MDKGHKFLSDLKLFSDYLGWDDQKNSYETWEEAVDAVLDTHREYYKDKLDQIEPYLNKAGNLYKSKRILASQRALQFRGNDIFKHPFRQYNCCTLYADKASFLGNAFYLLLAGAGVGVNMMQPFTQRLASVVDRSRGIKTYVVKDSIEGWASAAHVLISSYLTKAVEGYEEYQGYRIKFDFSEVRPRGARVGRRFKAPGPEGLEKSFRLIENLLDSYVEEIPKPFKSILAYDCFMHLSDAVLTGGVRRSACSIIISPEDEDLVNAKVGNWREKNPQRARSNNSVGLLRYSFSEAELLDLVKKNEGMSDLGFVFLNNVFEVLNPCVVGDTWVNTKNGIKQAAELVDKPFTAIVDGKEYASRGFWLVGSKKCLTLKFRSGRTVTCTEGHMFKMFGSDAWVRAEDLRMGDSIAIQNNQDQVIEVDFDCSDFSKGYLTGSVIGDGNFNGDSAEIKFWNNKELMHSIAFQHLVNASMQDPRHKEISDSIKTKYSCLSSTKLYKLMSELGCVALDGSKVLGENIVKQSKNFLAGFLRGYFDADGSVIGDFKKGLSIRLTSSQLQNLQLVQEMLLSLGVTSTIYKDRQPEGYRSLPDGHGGMSSYYCRAAHELMVSRDSIDRFAELIGFSDVDKKAKLSSILSTRKREAYKSNFFDELSGVEDAGYQLVYDCSVEEVNAFSANGLMAHNCFEIGFTPIYFDYTDESIKERIQASDITVLDIPGVVTGIQCCNLCEGNGALCKSESDFLEMCEALAIIGTLQAGYTKFDHIAECLEATIKITEHEALLGCSITGWANQPWLFEKPDLLRKGAELIKEVNAELAQILGINVSARTTCVKPSGNASVILGCASGIHPEHAQRFFRVMQLNKLTDTAKWLEKNSPEMLEHGVYSATGTDWAVYVPIDHKTKVLVKEELKGIEHLEKIKMIQQNWVVPGKRPESCIVPTTSHNVSNTVIIDDYDEIASYLFNNQEYFTAVSFLSMFGDKDYPQAPFTSVLSVQEIIEKYGKGALFASGLIVDGLAYFDNDLWRACNAIINPEYDITGTREITLLRKDWITRAKNFAKNYFKGDMEAMIYCLKDVHLCHKWEKITSNFKNVDFSKILGKPEYVDISSTAAIACHGGSCEITRI